MFRKHGLGLLITASAMLVASQTAMAVDSQSYSGASCTSLSWDGDMDVASTGYITNSGLSWRSVYCQMDSVSHPGEWESAEDFVHVFVYDNNSTGTGLVCVIRSRDTDTGYYSEGTSDTGDEGGYDMLDLDHVTYPYVGTFGIYCYNIGPSDDIISIAYWRQD